MLGAVGHRRLASGPDLADVRRPWAVLFVLLVLLNAYFLVGQGYWLKAGLTFNDWSGFVTVDPADPLGLGWMKWSLPAAWLMAAVIVPIGFGLWAALHVAALALLRDRTLILFVAISFPFWADVLNGNVLTFVFVAAILALRGNTLGIVAYCVLAALIPRPLVVPVLAWLVLRSPVARWSFALAVVAVLGITVWQGELGTWVANLALGVEQELPASHNFAPSLVIGSAWVLVAWPLAVLAWRRGHLGVASILASPYWLGYYFVMLFLEWPRLDPDREPVHLRRPASVAVHEEREAGVAHGVQ